jgi:hypothetical protein
MLNAQTRRSWFDERRERLWAELRHAEMMSRASGRAVLWEARIDAIHTKLERLAALGSN